MDDSTKGTGKGVREFLFTWLPAIGWAALIFFLSSRPQEDFPSVQIPGIDKIAHFIEYGIFGVLLHRGFARSGFRWDGWSSVVLVIAMSGVYGLLDEWHQAFVGSRNVEILDIIADVMGGGAGVFVRFFLLKRTHEK